MATTTFLVEAYRSGADLGAETRLRDRCVAAADAGIRYLGAVRVPSDETAFFLVAAPNEDDVRRLLREAAVEPDRIVVAEPAGLIGVGPGSPLPRI